MTGGILHEASEPGPEISERQLFEWYDKQIESRLDGSVPELHSCAQYIAADGKKPSLLVMYDSTSTDALTDLRADLDSAGAVAGADMVARLTAFHASLGALLSDSGETGSTAPYLMTGFMTPGEGDDEEFNRWYAEEHLGDMEKVPGWRRARRFRLFDSAERGDGSVPKAKASYAAIYDMAHFDGLNSQEYEHACTTPWTAKMTTRCPVAQMRKWALVRTWQRQPNAERKETRRSS